MFIKRLRRISFLNAVALFSVAVVVAVVSIYFVFDLYLSSVSRELVTSWIQSEAVAIQEGNLLTSITKNQRVLLSSQFVKGVVLLDQTTTPNQKLIEVGDRIESPRNVSILQGDLVRVSTVGFFAKQVAYKVPDRPDLLLVFSIESQFVQRVFYTTVAALILFMIVLFGSFKAVQPREFLKRERYLKQALDEFITRDQPSEFIEQEFPSIVRWWEDKKRESEAARRLAVESESKMLLGELGARVAHDIRSPLNTINAVASSIKNLPENAKDLLNTAIQRIRDIANGVADINRIVLAERKQATKNSSVENLSEPTLLFPILESVIEEKLVQFHNRHNIDLKVSPDAYSTFAMINELEMRRTLSNLIDNAVEASEDTAKITLALELMESHAVIKILDQGKGIPSELLSRIGEMGFTYGKKNGSGLGVHYAKASVQSWKGKFEIDSKVDGGAEVRISLPRTPAPKWIATEVTLSKGTTLLVLDDDPTIHAVWQERTREISQDLKIEHFFDPQSIRSWFVQNNGKIGKYLLLSDYELRARDTNGLDVIERLGISHKDVVLVTSAYEDLSVRSKCKELNIKILPKPSLAFTPVHVI